MVILQSLMNQRPVRVVEHANLAQNLPTPRRESSTEEPASSGRVAWRANRRDTKSARSTDSSKSALYKKVQVPVLAANVDDKRHRRLDFRDVAEVLFGTDADVDPAARAEQAHHLGEMGLVRHQIVRRAKSPARSDNPSMRVQNSSSVSAAGSRSRRD